VVPGNEISDIVISSVSDPTLDAQNLYLVLARGVKMRKVKPRLRGAWEEEPSRQFILCSCLLIDRNLGESILVSKAMYRYGWQKQSNHTQIYPGRTALNIEEEAKTDN
jgi:hypothetical protein